MQRNGLGLMALMGAAALVMGASVDHGPTKAEPPSYGRGRKLRDKPEAPKPKRKHKGSKAAKRASRPKKGG